MPHAHLANVDVQIPIVDIHYSLRLIRIPRFTKAAVGTQTVSNDGRILIVHALRDISIDLNEGDRVCLIGPNGAGKTTLLRTMAGIYPHSGGVLDIDGTVFALLGATVSLNPDATGYENINLFADLYRWPRARMPEIVSEIEGFSELGEYLSLPTRVYSAGMQTRLGFAIATSQSPDILLVDEAISTGDTHFQNKAKERLSTFLSQAKIIVLASHSTELCRAICNKAMLLSQGSLVFFGDIEEGFAEYAKL